MPLYDYKILDEDGTLTGETFEKLFKAGTAPDVMVSDDGRKAHRAISLVARTPGRWGDSKLQYDPQLRASFSTIQERDKICYEKGLVPVDDLPKGTYERMHSAHMDYANHWKRQDDKLEDLAKKHGVNLATDAKQDDMAVLKMWDEYAPPKDVLFRADPGIKHDSEKLSIKDF